MTGLTAVGIKALAKTAIPVMRIEAYRILSGVFRVRITESAAPQP